MVIINKQFLYKKHSKQKEINVFFIRFFSPKTVSVAHYMSNTNYKMLLLIYYKHIFTCLSILSICFIYSCKCVVIEIIHSGQNWRLFSNNWTQSWLKNNHTQNKYNELHFDGLLHESIFQPDEIVQYVCITKTFM